VARQPTTRQRLLDAGMRLFAERGFSGTSVADIEEAVGLQPRRGGLYKHFASKHDLLESAVRRHLDDARSLAQSVGSLDAEGAASSEADSRSLLTSLGRVFLAEMDRLEALTRLLEHDAARLGQLTDAVKAEAVDLSYRTATRLVEQVVPAITDAEATAVVMLGSLVAFRRTMWTFGSPPLAIDDDRFIEAWASATLGALGLANRL
jgi:AcrR family transcriptional regulator